MFLTALVCIHLTLDANRRLEIVDFEPVQAINLYTEFRITDCLLKLLYFSPDICNENCVAVTTCKQITAEVRPETSVPRAVSQLKLRDNIRGSCILIRPSVDGLYRDGTIHISREMHKQCFITRRETIAERQNPTDIAHGPFASHRNSLRVVTNLRLSTREIAHMRNPNFRHHNILSSSSFLLQ